MNKNVIIGIVVVVVVLLGAYLFMHKTPTTSTPVVENNQTSSTGTNQNQSIKDLLAAGQSVKCTYTSGEGGVNSSGTVYVSGGRMRGDFVVSGGSTGQTESHMIMDNGTSYVWQGSSSQGIKMKVSTPGAAPQPGQSQGFDYNSAVGYQCQPWSPNSDSFALPKSVTFTDTSAMMQPR